MICPSPPPVFLMLLNRSMNNFITQKNFFDLFTFESNILHIGISHFIKKRDLEILEISFKNVINLYFNLLVFKILHMTQQATIFLLEESFGGCAVLKSDAMTYFVLTWGEFWKMCSPRNECYIPLPVRDPRPFPRTHVGRRTWPPLSLAGYRPRPSSDTDTAPTPDTTGESAHIKSYLSNAKGPTRKILHKNWWTKEWCRLTKW